MEDQSGTELGSISSSAIALSSSALFLASCSLSSLCWTGIETYTILGGLGYPPAGNALFKLYSSDIFQEDRYTTCQMIVEIRQK